MPVVISLLNSFTGVAAACGGFMYDNKAMLTGGILVGAAGTLLTMLMCKAMNRSLINVLIGSFGGSKTTDAVAGKQQGAYKEISLADAAMLMSYANKVMIVPGYGLAVAQAQHTCHELEKILSEKGVHCLYWLTQYPLNENLVPRFFPGKYVARKNGGHDLHEYHTQLFFLWLIFFP